MVQKKYLNLQKKNKAKIIYISSQSAAENSLSNYGKIKFEIEQIAEKYDAYIIKPGLIYDTRSQLGIYGYIENLVKKMPFIFVPNGLSKTINLCNIDMLIFTIVEILDNNNKNQKIDLFEKEKYTLIELVKNIAKKNNKKIILIPINYKLIFYILRSLEILNFKLNIKSDSLKSLL